ncbi:MAG: Zn-dependent exopeptidase M28 [Phycisphaerae bacterium]|nr:Zn-dependent exopeptidase M28 [Phycisphaerae bacterium]
MQLFSISSWHVDFIRIFLEGEMMKRQIISSLILAALIGFSLVNSAAALTDCPSADLNNDCFVDIDDLAIFSILWLEEYDLNDFAILSKQWQTGDRIQGIVNSVYVKRYQRYYFDIEDSGLGLYGGPYYDQGFRNRDGWKGLGTLGNQEARLYISDQFDALGLTVSIQGEYLNVVGELTGTKNPDKIYIIGAHYDHIGGERPGGDDNASGTAGVLEAAHILSQYKFESTIHFICFNAEEDGLKGSNDYLANLPAGKSISGMINMDMILRPGSDASPNAVIDADLEIIPNFPESIAWCHAFQQAAADYVPSMVVDETINYYNGNDSDHAPFVRAGLPAFLIIENSGTEIWGGSNDYYHTYEDASDRLANSSPSGVTYDYNFAADIVKASVALTAQEAILVP